MLLWAAVAFATAPLAAQANARATLSTEAEVQKEPNGTVLGRLAKGNGVVPGAVRGNWVEVRFAGWLANTAVRADRRDGYDLAVALAAGTTLRSAPGGGNVVGTVRAGVLFKQLERRGDWVRVERTAWLLKSATAPATETKPAAATPPAALPAKAPTAAPAADSSRATTVSGGATLASAPAGPPLATLEVPVAAEVLERRDGWAKIRLEGWVRETNIGEGGRSGGPSAADIRANPDRFVGETVEWTMQVLAIQTADELRPELPPGQPYVLARGPLPETGFIYLVVSREEAAKFRAMEPLAKVRIRATIRAGRSRFLPTPVLTFVRRLD
ncbi:MAG: hypothetical protein SFU84_14210 [Gemmatimonadales bacterium]|nr:hypothetical protein [Gemmatimonadales bacterium]